MEDGMIFGGLDTKTLGGDEGNNLTIGEKYDQKDKGDELFKWILENVIPSTRKGLLKWKCSQKRKLIQNATRGDKSMFSFVNDEFNPEKKYLVPNQQSQTQLIESFPKQYQAEIKVLLLSKIMNSKSK